MQFTGTELVRKRNFYTQNENFGVSVNFSVDNPTGRYEFGVSGTSSLGLVLESGIIKYNDLFIQSYLPNNDYSILMEMTSGSLNLIKDDYEIAYGIGKQTGNFDYVYFKRENDSIDATFDFYVSGENLPNYSIDKTALLFNSGVQEVTGKFTNIDGYEIRFFESISKGLQGLTYNFIKTGINSGEQLSFKYSGDFSSFDFTQPISTSFYTNFGNDLVNFKIINVSSLDKFILLDEIDSYDFNSDNQINRELFYTNYSGGILTDSFGTELSIKLNYLDGSGTFTVNDFAQSASFTGFAYGNFFESGIVTGVALIQTGNSSLTGIYSVPFNRFQWAVGSVTGHFTGYGTGIASGINYTGLAYGPISGSVVATVQNGSGSFIFLNVLATGTLFDSGAAIGYTGYSNATGFISLSGVPIDSAFFIGVESAPIIRGLTYYDETGLVYYLSGNPQHKVDSYVDGDIIRLVSLSSGELGNGTFIRNFQCDPSLSLFSEYLTGGTNFGQTGFEVYSVGVPFSGYINSAATGSGDYRQYVSGNQVGQFTFVRTFTGAWEIYTGLAQGSLQKVPRINDSEYSGYAGNLSANSSIVFQVNHNENEFNEESVLLTITGANIINSISKIITQ